MTAKAKATAALLAGAIAAYLLAGCRTAAPAAPAERRNAGAADDASWVESTLAGLSLAQKAAQMLSVRVYSGVDSPESARHRDLLSQVRDLEVGGVVLFGTDRDAVPILVNELQDAAPLPLLVAADVERSLSFRIPEGVVSVPYAMAIGATRSEAAARFVGELTARESLAMGIQWALAPVVDVNNDPGNPVIHIRSFGEDPELVRRLGAAFVEGARAGGVLTTAKHFPGHGDTAIDSHLDLPVIGGDRERLERVELAPFRGAIGAGVDTVMMGHLEVPALDPSGAPATLSPAITTGVLRGELGFTGLAVTDAMDMKGVGGTWLGGAVVRAIQAGADIVLLPPDPRVAIQSIVRAVEEGELDTERIDASVRRILTIKARFGLHRHRFVDPLAARSAVGRLEDEARALEIARDSITVVRNEGGVLPLRAEEPLRVLHLVLSSDWVNAAIGDVPRRELAARDVAAETRRLGPEISEATADEIVTAAPGFTHVLVSAYVRVTSSRGNVDLDPTHAALVERLSATGIPVVVVSYSSPYLLGQVPGVQVYVCTYGPADASQRAALASLFGESAVTGKLPVTIPGLASFGDGFEIPRRAMTLESTSAEGAGFRPQGLAEIDRLLDDFVARGAFPGGVLAVGRRGKLAHLRAFGHQTYAAGSPRVTPETIYDLASLTKVVATTTMAMILVDERRLDLDLPVQSYLPLFRGPGKERVTVRHLLTHSSGVDWWAPLYQELSGQKAYLERVQAMDLADEPGTQTKYSDLGLMLLGEILARVSGQSLDEFLRQRVFEPLGMRDTMYRPGSELLPRIAPTERDAWRDRVVHGEVHDENAFALGGVAPHAGLFSTAPDLARFAQMLLNGGVFEHHRIVSRATVELFTRRAGVVEGSDRALGWDTKSAEDSSAGALFSASSFGHTGFTGTSIWVDPERQLFVVLLTNRVHPTRERKLIYEARPAIADAVIRALAGP